MLFIAGRTASGKSTLVDYLVENHGFKKLVTYTTRPPRKGEVDGVDYHFITNEEFNPRVRAGEFAEWQSYQMADGNWVSYGTRKEDLLNADDKTVCILTPKGILDIQYLHLKQFIIYLYANDTTLFSRLHERGDDKWECQRRINADRKDFEGFDMVANKIVYSNLGQKLKDVAKKTVDLYEEWLCKKN